MCMRSDMVTTSGNEEWWYKSFVPTVKHPFFVFEIFVPTHSSSARQQYFLCCYRLDVFDLPKIEQSSYFRYFIWVYQTL